MHIFRLAHSSDTQNKLSEVDEFVLKKHYTREMNHKITLERMPRLPSKCVTFTNVSMLNR